MVKSARQPKCVDPLHVKTAEYALKMEPAASSANAARTSQATCASFRTCARQIRARTMAPASRTLPKMAPAPFGASAARISQARLVKCQTSVLQVRAKTMECALKMALPVSSVVVAPTSLAPHVEQ